MSDVLSKERINELRVAMDRLAIDNSLPPISQYRIGIADTARALIVERDKLTAAYAWIGLEYGSQSERVACLERENAALRAVGAKVDALISRLSCCQDAEDDSDDGHCTESSCEYCELDRAMGDATRVLGEKRGAWKAGQP